MKHIKPTTFTALYVLALRLRRIVWGLQRPITVGVRALIVHGDAVLLVRHRAGPYPWSLPGGGVKRYERLQEAARREVQEEAGVIVRIEQLLGVYDGFHEGVTNYVTVFICTPLGDPQLSPSIEIAESRYFPLAAPPDGLDHGSRRRIEEYLAGERGLAGLW